LASPPPAVTLKAERRNRAGRSRPWFLASVKTYLTAKQKWLIFDDDGGKRRSSARATDHGWDVGKPTTDSDSNAVVTNSRIEYREREVKDWPPIRRIRRRRIERRYRVRHPVGKQQ
jgi:hypothetical protein